MSLSRSLLASLAISSLVACASEEEPLDPGLTEEEAGAIDAYLLTLPFLPVDPPKLDKQEASAPVPEGDYQCTTQNYSQTQQFDKVVAYAANSDALYPGAIVGADSVLSGLFTQIVLPRSPATISVSLENLAGSKSAVVANPSLSSYREALAGILQKEITGSTPANLSSEIEQVHSEQQLDMALGIQAGWGLGIASLKTSFDFQSSAVRSRYLVKFTQAYYTVDLDAPERPSALFGSQVRLADVQREMTAERPPAYVSSVTYGRMVLFTFESEYSGSEMAAALEFAYKGGQDVSGNVSVTYKDILSRSKITAFILGGDAGMATRSIESYEDLVAFIQEGGNYSRESPGAPIAYKLNYLKDNSPARMSATTDYDVRTCNRVSQRVKVTLNSVLVENAGGDGNNDMELFGLIWAEGLFAGVPLFDKPRDEYVTIAQGMQWGSPGMPIAETVISVSPNPGESVKLRAHMWEADPTADDDIGDEMQVHTFEAGWRKDTFVTLTGATSQVKLNFSMTPI